MEVFLEKIVGDNEKENEPRAAGGDERYARMAVYDNLLVSPRVVELSAAGFDEFVSLLASKAYQSSQEKGGSIPFTLIKEIIENLIHACFREVTVTILDDGNTVRISDHGPGIKDKIKAMMPGFSTASREMKNYIKGVGSGLPVVRESISFLGGTITVDDNMDSGTVITLKLPQEKEPAKTIDESSVKTDGLIGVQLNKRQRKVLFLVTEIGSIGPSRVASELGISLSTAYRDLAVLEDLDLIKTVAGGKRTLTATGIEKLDFFVDS